MSNETFSMPLSKILFILIFVPALMGIAVLGKSTRGDSRKRVIQKTTHLLTQSLFVTTVELLAI
ncbi:hypothetical protein PsAD37_00895 [Pseudovibrio sp. Ad37]|nr:hypothetical protein PsAD37_00895 [Pseudovibrio sp. Ad37]